MSPLPVELRLQDLLIAEIDPTERLSGIVSTEGMPQHATHTYPPEFRLARTGCIDRELDHDRFAEDARANGFHCAKPAATYGCTTKVVTRMAPAAGPRRDR